MKTKILASISGLIVSLITPLALLVPQASAVTDTCTWTGGVDNLFNNVGNWNCSVDGAAVPENGDSLIFDLSILSGADAIITNDMTLDVAGISASGTSDYGYLIQGNDLTVSGLIDSGASSDSLSLAINLILGANTTVNGSGSVSIGSGGGSLDLSTFSLTLNMPNGHLYSEGSLLGSGNLTIDNGWFHTSNNAGTYSGDITVSGGYLDLFDGSISDTSSVTVTDGQIRLDSSTEFNDYGMPFTLGTSDPTQTILYTIGDLNNDYPIAFSGGVTLTSDVKFLVSEDITITEPFDDGGFDITVVSGSVGAVRLPGGVVIVKLPTTTTIEANDISSAAVTVYDKDTVIVNGERGSAYIYDGGTLKGTGVITGSVNIATGGILAPGLSPGCLGTGNLSLSGTYQVEIAGNTVCTQYDQTVVTGTVNLSPSGNATLNATFLNNFTPLLNDQFIIINNDSNDAVSGTFEGLAQGASVIVGSVTFQISYVGGDGNDVVLTATSVPVAATVPDTGIEQVLHSPVMALFAVILSLGVLVGINKVQSR